MIYLDNAATTLIKPPSVGEAMVDALMTNGNAGRGASPQSLSAARTIYETRERLARLFGISSPSRIAFTSNATESLNIAIHGIIEEGDHVIVTQTAHNSVLRPLYYLEETKKIELSIVSVDSRGVVSAEEIEKSIKKSTKVIIGTHASNVTGNIMPIHEMGAIAREHDLIFVVDAAQTAGTIPIDVNAMNIDILCFTGHKGLLGPQGTGGIYVREGVAIKEWKSGGSGTNSYSKKQPQQMPELLEAGTLNGHGIAGLNAALKYIEEVGVDEIHRRESELIWRFYRGVQGIENLRIYGEFVEEKPRCPILSLNIEGYESAEVSDALLGEYDIVTRAGAHCAPLMHVALGTEEQGCVRFSTSYFTTEEEIDRAIQAIAELASEN